MNFFSFYWSVNPKSLSILSGDGFWQRSPQEEAFAQNLDLRRGSPFQGVKFVEQRRIFSLLWSTQSATSLRQWVFHFLSTPS